MIIKGKWPTQQVHELLAKSTNQIILFNYNNVIIIINTRYY